MARIQPQQNPTMATISNSSSNRIYTISCKPLSPSSLYLRRLCRAPRTGRKSSKPNGGLFLIRAYVEESASVSGFASKLIGALPVVGLLARIISDDGGVVGDLIDFAEFRRRVGKKCSVNDSTAFYDFQDRHGKGSGGEPLNVLMCCWLAAVGAGLLKSEEILEGVARLRISDDIEFEEENFIAMMNEAREDPNGGYGGGPGQIPHLATTYAAVNTLITVGGDISLSSINRMHDGGEIDVRACYTAIAVASVLNILDDRLIENVGDFISSCQTYEGGIAGEQGSEAHGGYTFCGLAAMVLINVVHRLDLPTLIGGAAAIIQRLLLIVNKQLGLPYIFKHGSSAETDNCSTDSDFPDRDQAAEGGASSPVNDIYRLEKEGAGISNASHPIELNKNGDNFIRGHICRRPLFNSVALQQYILLCSQEEMGFRDKPGKHRDHYHTCYVLSGLSICHYNGIEHANSPPLPRDILGSYSNLLEPVHPLYNIVLDKYYEAYEFFARSSTY